MTTRVHTRTALAAGHVRQAGVLPAPPAWGAEPRPPAGRIRGEAAQSTLSVALRAAGGSVTRTACASRLCHLHQPACVRRGPQRGAERWRRRQTQRFAGTRRATHACPSCWPPPARPGHANRGHDHGRPRAVTAVRPALPARGARVRRLRSSARDGAAPERWSILPRRFRTPVPLSKISPCPPGCSRRSGGESTRIVEPPNCPKT